VAVVEWIERWVPAAARPDFKPHHAGDSVTRFAFIETLSETERRITYEDSGT
jgi:hypothetical protein